MTVALTRNLGTCTISIANPAVVTLTDHGLGTGYPCAFASTGNLPSPLVAGTTYYAIRIDADTFELATSLANALAGTAIATNLIANYGAEIDASGWQGATGGETITSDATQYHSGAKSFKVVTNGGSGMRSTKAASPAASAGQNWAASAWVDAPVGESMFVQIAAYSAADALLGYQRTNFTGTGAWQSVAISYANLPATTAYVVVFVRRSSGGSITFYADDCTLTDGWGVHTLFGPKSPWEEKLEIAFGCGPSDTVADADWTDVSADLAAGRSRARSIAPTRGRSYDLDRIDAGSMPCTLTNLDGKLTPGNTSGYNAKARHPIRYSVNGQVQWRGFTGGFPPSYPGVKDAIVQVQALDAMSLLNRRKFPAGTTFPQESIGDRFVRVLQTTLGYSADTCDLDAGLVTCTETDDMGGQNPLSHLQELALAEGGRFFVSRAGLWTFRDVFSTLVQFATNCGTFGFSDGDLIYRLVSDQLDHDDSKIVNHVEITAGSGNVFTADDLQSQHDYGICDFTASWGITDADAQARAYRIVHERSQPVVRIPALEILHTRCPDVAWPVLDALEIGQRFTFDPPSNAIGLTTCDVIVEGTSASSAKGEYHALVQLSLADPQRYWLAGIAGFSEADSTTYAFPA